MNILICVIFLTVLAFGIHWVAWRMAVPKRQTRALLFIFLATPLTVAVLASLFPESAPPWWPANAWEWAHVGTSYVAVMLAYVVVYSAVEERSPSMTLLSHVSRTSANGRTRMELESILGQASPVEIRLDALVRDRMVEEREGMLRLTAKGAWWAATFENTRKVLGFGRGG